MRDRLLKLLEIAERLARLHQNSDLVPYGTLFSLLHNIDEAFKQLDKECKAGNLPREWHSGIKFCSFCKVPLPKGYGADVCTKCRFSSKYDKPADEG